jgi:hypothetical protein
MLLQTSDEYTEATSVTHGAPVIDETAVQLVPQLSGVSTGDLTSLMC